MRYRTLWLVGLLAWSLGGCPCDPVYVKRLARESQTNQPTWSDDSKDAKALRAQQELAVRKKALYEKKGRAAKVANCMRVWPRRYGAACRRWLGLYCKEHGKGADERKRCSQNAKVKSHCSRRYFAFFTKHFPFCKIATLDSVGRLR